MILILCIIYTPSAYAEKEGACVKPDRTGIVGKSIRAHADRIRGAHDCGSRKYAELDMNGDGDKDMIVTYAIGGACFEDKKSPPGSCGNHHEEFLSMFLKHKGKYGKPIIRQVGGRNIRIIEGISAKGSTVILDTLEYDDDDPSCCPSKPGKLRFILKGNKLVEKK